MAITGSILDYTGAAGDRNYTVFIQLVFSGSYVVGGDTLNLATLSNPNGLEIEGFFEFPLSIAPAPYIENLNGAYTQPVISVKNGNAAATQGPLTAFLIQCFGANGTELTATAYAAPFTIGTVVYSMQKRRV
jgi:hypothetical protein